MQDFFSCNREAKNPAPAQLPGTVHDYMKQDCSFKMNRPIWIQKIIANQNTAYFSPETDRGLPSEITFFSLHGRHSGIPEIAGAYCTPLGSVPILMAANLSRSRPLFTPQNQAYEHARHLQGERRTPDSLRSDHVNIVQA